VQVEACGVCHGDVLGVAGGSPFLKGVYPLTPGHEVVGWVETLGEGVSAWKKGDRVGVGWSSGSCGKCEACRTQHGHGCKDELITGLKRGGGYGEMMIAHTSALVHIPDGISAVEAAPLLCAGNTVLGALRKANLHAGDTVAVQGMGGLGHLAIQYCHKMGFRTIAVSRGTEKEKLVRQLGAHAYIDAAATDAGKELQKLGGAKYILCTAGNVKALENLVGGLQFGGELCFVAIPEGPLTLNGAQLLTQALRVGGFVGGNKDDAVKFSVLAGIKPICEEFPIEKAQEAYDKMLNASVKFRSVIVHKHK
jgi:propanol-preferring alcohol dehydrogenase